MDENKAVHQLNTDEEEHVAWQVGHDHVSSIPEIRIKDNRDYIKILPIVGIPQILSRVVGKVSKYWDGVKHDNEHEKKKKG